MENIRKKIITILKEEIQNNSKLLTERWSYSDKIDQHMDYIYDIVSEGIKSSSDEIHRLDYGIGLRKGKINDIKIFGIENITLFYYIYESANINQSEFIIKNAYSLNGYDEDNKILYLTLYTINGQLVEQPSNKNVSHELEHLLQISLGSKHNPRYSKLTDAAYKYASEIISNGNTDNPDTLAAWLVYYSNPHEQDAFINEYYQDLRSNTQFINDENSETHIRLIDYQSKINKFNSLSNGQQSNILSNFKLYGYTPKNFSIMLMKSIKRFKRKINNVEKHFKNVVKSTNENKIHALPAFNGSIIWLF